MTYDSWKLDNAWDEEARRLRARRVPCEDCDERFATECWDDPAGETYLCERCADRRRDHWLEGPTPIPDGYEEP